MKKVEIDAKGEKLGRVASRAAGFLMGKDLANFERNKTADVEVKITNASKLEISEAKRTGKIYTHYTGYPGGLREEKMGKLIDKKGYEEVIKKAVRGMLPSNKLRSEMLRHLTIEE